MMIRKIYVYVLMAISLISCTGGFVEKDSTPFITSDEPILILPTNSPGPNATDPRSHSESTLANYGFPDTMDPTKQYLFYLHGKIIEDQGIPAISPDYGEYAYEAILEKLSGYGFVVISEARPKNTDGIAYARKIAEEITVLLDAGIPPKNISVVGASKGAGIAVFVSHFLENEEVNFVIMAICHPDIVEAFKQDQIYLTGNVLSIYDFNDEYAGSCQELFSFSEGKGIGRYDEIVLNIGTGHGILYQPLDVWIMPAIEWAQK